MRLVARRVAVAASWLALVGCGGGEPEGSVQTRADDITGVVSTAQPDFATAVNVTSGTGSNQCYGVLISPSWVLTAAHCFNDKPPETSNVSAFGVSADQVRFHPETWPDGEEIWATSHPTGTVSPPYDVALLHLVQAQSEEPVRLYHPPSEPGLGGQDVFMWGTNTDTGTGGGLGKWTLGSLFQTGFGPLLSATAGNPSAGVAGDSGGGAYLLTVPSELPHSGGFFIPCSPQVAQPGSGPALVGIYHGSEISSTVKDLFVPVYYPQIAEWIGQNASDDFDGDGVCDEIDNCPVPNDQANCNALIEQEPAWESDGSVLGDACDPAPCPVPKLNETGFVASVVTPLFEIGRSIRDEVALHPVLDPALGPVSSNAAKPRFCQCRDDATGKPIDDADQCALEPYFCILDPLQARSTYSEVGGLGWGAPSQNETYWHKLSIDYGALTVNGLDWSVAYPGSDVLETWDYWADFDVWVTQNGWFDTLPLDGYPVGTDLAGALWFNDQTQAGTEAHAVDEACQLIGGEHNCSFADDFLFYAAPDGRAGKWKGYELPETKPPPFWTYCAECGGGLFKVPGERVYDPAPFLVLDAVGSAVTAFLETGGVDITTHLTSTLRATLVSPDIVIIPMSAAPGMTQSWSTPLAVGLTVDGTDVRGYVVRTATGFDWVDELSGGSTMQPRRDFAAAWSRTANALFVAGGTILSSGAPAADVWTFRPGAGWSSVALDVELTPTEVHAAAFSHRDWRLWLAQPAGAGAWEVVRIDPATGRIVTKQVVSGLRGLSPIWMTATDRGEIIIAGNRNGAHRLYRLDGQKYAGAATIEVTGEGTYSGTLGNAPVVRHGRISLMLESPSESGILVTVKQIDEAEL